MGKTKYEVGDKEMRQQHEQLEQDKKTRLAEIIPAYVENKSMLDDYKKICENDNSEIKGLMISLGIDDYEVGGYVAKKTVATRDSLNEQKLLDEFNVDNTFRELMLQRGIIKTREYVDIDALEGYVYELGNDSKTADAHMKLLEVINKCRTQKEVVTLRVIKKKERL